MSAIRPTSTVVWTDGSADKVVDPPSAQQLSGWTEGEPIPFQYLNFLFWNLYQWQAWFDFINGGSGGAGLVSNISANTTGAVPFKYYFCNTSGGGFTFTLPDAATFQGQEFNVMNTTFGGSNNVTVARTGSNLINGDTSDSIDPGTPRRYVSNGTNWYVLNA